MKDKNIKTIYKIEVIDNIEDDKYSQLKSLIKDFAINVFIVQKFDLFNKNNRAKKEYINNYKNYLSAQELKELEADIESRINFAKNSILSKDEEKITRYYILLKNEEVISFQTAQIRKENCEIEGWRNFAYIKPEYAGLCGNVINTYNIQKKGLLSNIIYEDISEWFYKNNVVRERTATGKHMYKNILAYIVHKGFVPENVDEQRIYLIKNYDDEKTKEELKLIYANYVEKMEGKV